MNRILVIGGNGSGKTTLSRLLSARLRLPLVHLDALYWRGNWQVTPADRFQEALQKELVKPSWIIDGNLSATLSLRLAYCDTVIYLDYTRWACVCGVIRRVLHNYGKSRPDMGGYCPERFDAAFLKSVWNFNKRNRARYYRLLGDADVRLIVLKNRRQMKRFLATL
ncbi:MAG: topology modulation protein [Eubacteriales bacterium]|nr:topology modulation protein [Eubacteriales bacterium]